MASSPESSYTTNCEAFAVATYPKTVFERGIETVQVEHNDGTFDIDETEPRRFLDLLGRVAELSFRGYADPDDYDRRELAFILHKDLPPRSRHFRVSVFSVLNFDLRSRTHDHYLSRSNTLTLYRQGFGQETGRAALLGIVDPTVQSFSMGQADVILPEGSEAKVLQSFSAGDGRLVAGVSAVLVPENHGIIVRRDFDRPGSAGSYDQIRYLPRDTEDGLIVERFRPEQPSGEGGDSDDSGGNSGDREPRYPLRPLDSEAEEAPAETEPEFEYHEALYV